MSKKSGFFYSLLAMVGLVSMATKQNMKTSYEPNEPKNHPKGKRHRTFGKEITSFGTKPDYGHLKRKPFYQELRDARRRKHQAKVWELKQEGIIWTDHGLYTEKAV
jgi:hypothetical protein